MLPTPDTSHLKEVRFSSVYEPAEDTFLLLDALELEVKDLHALKPSICVEIGPGSGCVLSFLARLLKPQQALLLGLDINRQACEASLVTAQANGCSLMEIVHANMCDAVASRLEGAVDLLLFNPPYVATEDEEYSSSQLQPGIASAWAGGFDGTILTNKVLSLVKVLLSEKGRFYLVTVEENKPHVLMQNMSDEGFSSHIVLKRRAGREHLSVIAFQRDKSS